VISDILQTGKVKRFGKHGTLTKDKEGIKIIPSS